MLNSQLHDVIVESLNMELYSNAVFFAEKLLSECDMEEVKYLLAKGYIGRYIIIYHLLSGEGKYHKAFQALKETKSPHCRYLFATVCIKMNQLVEAERALMTHKLYTKSLVSKEVESVIPFGAAGFYLLGTIAEKLNRKNDAYNAFKHCLELDPFMWCAYEKLCKLNPTLIEPSKIFSELNPKILVFLKKYANGTSNGVNYFSNQRIPLVQNINAQTKDFSLSPDKSNQNKNQFSSTENKFSNLNQGKKPNSRFELVNAAISSEESEKYRSFLDFNSNNPCPNSNLSIPVGQFSITNSASYQTPGSNMNIPSGNPNMTPVIHKDKNELNYSNMNYNYPVVKNQDHSKPFVFSSSPNQIALEFNKSGEGNKTNTNLNSSGTNININPNACVDSSIRPFTINQSGMPLPQNTEFTPKEIKNILQGSFSRRNEDSAALNNNLFNNIQLNENRAPGNLNQMNLSKEKTIKAQGQSLNTLLQGTELGSKFTDIAQMMKHYGEIVKLVNLYCCEEAISLIKSLPGNHQRSSWCLGMLGRCYFELARYKDCEKAFKEALKVEPARLEGMEYFSSCLWHLKDQYQSCNLAHHVLEQSQFSPETWIVLGNCYSLQKEHEIAIKFFTRATQINPTFAYAYTLCGHEYVDNESYNQAKACYSQALSCDERHFNAWWGLGNIQMKEQNYGEAIKFFRKAHSINQNSAILNFYLASAYQQNKEMPRALHFLSLAEKSDPSNPMIKYQKANILISNVKYDEALNILLELNEKMPKEAPIHILIGRIYKSKKDYTKALAHFNAAIDIDPKDSNLAKSLIEKLYSDIDSESVFNIC